MQHTSLKVLARKALARNMPCNGDATKAPKPCNIEGDSCHQNVARDVALLHAVRDRLLTIARSLGLPDALVLELPASELEAAAEQVTWMGDAETGHKLLVFYLRALAG